MFSAVGDINLQIGHCLHNSHTNTKFINNEQPNHFFEIDLQTIQSFIYATAAFLRKTDNIGLGQYSYLAESQKNCAQLLQAN